MSRNYGLGTRDMASAGRIALNQAVERRDLSFASVDAIADRFSKFASYAKERGIGRMERVDADLVREYGRDLANQVCQDEMTASYAQNLVSALNTVMTQATRGEWQSVSPTKDCGIEQRSAIRETAPTGYDRQEFSRAVTALRESGMERQACIAELARELGLRSKEASLLDARAALAEANKTSAVTITEGTKGGRKRSFSLTLPTQLAVLTHAAAVQGKGRNLIPAENSWKEWRQGGLRDGREALQVHGIDDYRDLRAAYACERYEVLTGHPAPVMGGHISNRDADRKAREAISIELGHGHIDAGGRVKRIDVIAEYIGGRGK